MASDSVATVAIWRVAPPSSRSSQAVQILYERVDLVLGEDGPAGLPIGPDVHVVPGLHRLRIAQPISQIRVGAIQGDPSEGRAVGEVREIGADDPRRGSD